MPEAIHPCSRTGCSRGTLRRVLTDRLPNGGAEFDFQVCTLCDFGFVDPFPSDEQLATLYGSDYAYFDAAESADRGMPLKFALAALRYRQMVEPGPLAKAQAALASAVERISGKTITYSLGLPLTLSKDARILEIGCGSGYWLRAMRRRGYKRLHGFDIGLNSGFRDRLEKAGVVAYDEAGLASVPSDSFDLIRLEHVFEHLPDPIGDLTRFHDLLVSGGWLVMTFPSILPWLHRQDLVESPDRDHLQLPRHLTHHSPESARRLLVEAGFNVEGLRVTQRERFITVAARRKVG